MPAEGVLSLRSMPYTRAGAFTNSLKARQHRVRLFMDHNSTQRAGTLYLTDSPTALQVRAIQGAARVKRPWGHSSPLPFCAVTAYDDLGRPVSALEAIVEWWCGFGAVTRFLLA
jgi:hypothetical protein